MDMNMLTQKSIEAVKNAEQIAIDHDHMEIQPEHLLLALLTQENGVVGRLFERLGKNTYPITQELKGDIDNMPSVTGPGREPGKVYISRDTDKIMNEAYKEAKKMEDQYISCLLYTSTRGCGWPRATWCCSAPFFTGG